MTLRREACETNDKGQPGALNLSKSSCSAGDFDAITVASEGFLIGARCTPLVFTDQLRLEGAVAITWRLIRDFTQLAAHSFAGATVASFGARHFGKPPDDVEASVSVGILLDD